MPIDRARTLRGALAGAAAAAVWALQMPLDKRLFGSDYDDVEVLGKAITRGPAWRPVGFVLHVNNGAIFGAAYANVVPAVPLPSWTRGPLAALIENFSAWPLAAVSDRLHPARDELPVLASSGRAFAQATWRHLVFGVVLGELERRLNSQQREDLPTYAARMSSNGHGNLEHAAVGETG
jgi:hypothetical protein